MHYTYFKTCLSVLLAALTLLAGLNLAVDPYDIYNVVRSARLDSTKLERIDLILSRTSKIEMLYQSPCETLLVGSSRVEMGLNPRCAAWGCDEVYNLGLTATSIAEIAQVCRFATRQESLRRIVLLIEFENFAVNGYRSKLDETRCNLQKDAADYHLGNLLGFKVTENSVKTLLRSFRSSRPADWTVDRGFLNSPPPPGEYRDKFDHVMRRDLRDLFSHYIYSQRGVQAFQQIVTDCREAGIELVVALSPVHALYLETIYQAGLWPTFERWKQDLVRVVESDRRATRAQGSAAVLWDFTGYSQYTCEAVPAPRDPNAQMRWYVECSHYTPALGDLLISRIQGCPPADGRRLDDFGVRLDKLNLDLHLTMLRRQREEYVRSFAEEVQHVAQLAHEAGIVIGQKVVR